MQNLSVACNLRNSARRIWSSKSKPELVPVVLMGRVRGVG
jgi:hypothetical protein